MWKTIYLIFLLCLLTVNAQAQKNHDYTAELTGALKALASKDYAEAYRKFQQVADHNPLAQFNLALFHHFGWGRPVDEATACRWYAKAAKGDIPVAQHFYADCLLEGKQTKADPKQAAIWYQHAADNGHIISLCSLAELYIKGIGVSKDSQRGLALCQQAADRGISKAMLKMARFHLMANPKLHNPQMALAYLQQAAQNRNIEAQFMLAEIRRDGIDDQYIDLGKARYWFELAAANGYIPAYYQVGKLYFNAPVDPKTKLLPADALAKAYLWLTATSKRSQQVKEIEASRQMLQQIATVMPTSWLDDLNKKLDEHLAQYPSKSTTSSASQKP
jgi:TPR repeat protein